MINTKQVGYICSAINQFFVKMKKLLLSVAALMFATLLFSQDDSNDVKDDLTQDNVVKTEARFHAES